MTLWDILIYELSAPIWALFLLFLIFYIYGMMEGRLYEKYKNRTYNILKQNNQESIL